jgi:hypothetical protein
LALLIHCQPFEHQFMANIVKEGNIKAKVTLKRAVCDPSFTLQEGNHSWKHRVQPHLCLSFVSLIVPEVGKPMGRQRRVTNGMLNIAMPQVLLDGPGIHAFVGEIKTAGMPEHMGMNRKRQARHLTRSQHNMANRSVGQWPSSFGDKQIRRLRVVSAQLP